MKFKIETWKDNKTLRSISEPIGRSEIRKYSELWEEMIKFIKDPENNGVWLAAPQIWINKRLICVSLLKSYEDENFKTIYMINPEILDYSYDFAVDNEWCLSMPKVFWDVARAKNIKVKYTDSKWKENVLFLSWIPSRIVQHEIDHLNWVLFVDKIAQDDENPLKQHVL